MTSNLLSSLLGGAAGAAIGGIGAGGQQQMNGFPHTQAELQSMYLAEQTARSYSRGLQNALVTMSQPDYPAMIHRLHAKRQSYRFNTRYRHRLVTLQMLFN